MKKSNQTQAQAEKVFALLREEFPTVQDFNDLEYIVASFSLLESKRYGLSDEDAESFLCILQSLMWIRKALY